MSGVRKEQELRGGTEWCAHARVWVGVCVYTHVFVRECSACVMVMGVHILVEKPGVTKGRRENN